MRALLLTCCSCLCSFTFAFSSFTRYPGATHCSTTTLASPSCTWLWSSSTITYANKRCCVLGRSYGEYQHQQHHHQHHRLQARPPVDAELIKKTAALASLEVSDEEVERLIPRVESFLGFVETMESVDTSRVLQQGEGSVIVNQGGIWGGGEGGANANAVLREDVLQRFDNVMGIMDNLPEEENNYLVVPKVGPEEARNEAS